MPRRPMLCAAAMIMSGLMSGAADGRWSLWESTRSDRATPPALPCGSELCPARSLRTMPPTPHSHLHLLRLRGGGETQVRLQTRGPLESPPLAGLAARPPLPCAVEATCQLLDGGQVGAHDTSLAFSLLRARSLSPSPAVALSRSLTHTHTHKHNRSGHTEASGFGRRCCRTCRSCR